MASIVPQARWPNRKHAGGERQRGDVPSAHPFRGDKVGAEYDQVENGQEVSFQAAARILPVGGHDDRDAGYGE